jgi:deoxyguanosine kinase
MNTTQAYIAIEGVIGVGKTTLARMFQKEVDARLVLEVFEENPFLSSFYTDRARYAFQTQIFFLLSRYHQQRQLATIPRQIISDYMFEKDRLFAQVNLAGDELQTYYSVQEALAENIRHPDLVVYLRADTETLMSRITDRDRPYERNMDPAYIESLRAAYEQFFSAYKAGSVLIIDTNNVDFVRNPDDREAIFNRIRGALGEGPRQPALPGLETGQPPITVGAGEQATVGQTARRLSEIQQFHRQLDHEVSASTDPYVNFVLLQEGIGELARAFRQRWMAGATAQSNQSLPSVRAELAAVLADVIRLANEAGVDLEDAFLEKMRQRIERGQPVTPGAENEGT